MPEGVRADLSIMISATSRRALVESCQPQRRSRVRLSSSPRRDGREDEERREVVRGWEHSSKEKDTSRREERRGWRSRRTVLVMERGREGEWE